MLVTQGGTTKFCVAPVQLKVTVVWPTAAEDSSTVARAKTLEKTERGLVTFDISVVLNVKLENLQHELATDY
jgi:hypothetical protein